MRDAKPVLEAGVSKDDETLFKLQCTEFEVRFTHVSQRVANFKFKRNTKTICFLAGVGKVSSV